MTGSEGRGRSGKRPLLRGGRDDRGRGDAGAGSGPLALSLWGGEGLAGAPRRLKACGLSLCGWRHIFIPKSTGRRIRKRLPGRYFSV